MSRFNEGPPRRPNPLKSHWEDVSPADKRHALNTLRRNAQPKNPIPLRPNPDPMAKELGPTKPLEVNTGIAEERPN